MQQWTIHGLIFSLNRAIFDAQKIKPNLNLGAVANAMAPFQNLYLLKQVVQTPQPCGHISIYLTRIVFYSSHTLIIKRSAKLTPLFAELKQLPALEASMLVVTKTLLLSSKYLYAHAGLSFRTN